MEFTVNKVDLVRELNLSQGVVEKKTTIPILSNVLVEAGTGEIILTATDLELGVRCSCAAEVRREGSGTIPARRLLDYVRLLPDIGINIKFSENHWAHLLCGRSRARIAGMSKESFPQLPDMPERLVELPMRLLGSMISRTIVAISSEESRFTLNGALLLIKPDRVTMVATDGHRLALCEYPMEFQQGELSYRTLLPRKAMLEILKLAQELPPEENVEFSGEENHLFFRAGKRLLISRKLTGNFPDYERVLPQEHPNSITLSREEFRATIDRVAQFSDERSHAIRMQFCPGELKVHSSLSDTGETEESLPIVYDGPTIEVGFNAQYIAEFLRAVTEQEVSFHFRDAASAGELRPSGEALNYKHRYIIMPMRI